MKTIIIASFLLVSSLNLYSQTDEYETMPYILGDILIMVDKNENINTVIEQTRVSHGINTELVIHKVISEPANIWHLHFNHLAISHVSMKSALQSNSHVKLVQNNHIVSERLVPNDANYGSQWYHNDGPSDNDIDSDLAWDITTGGLTANGDTIVVCVLEGSGANYNHPDLIGNHWRNFNEIDGNGIDDDNNGYIDDVNGWNVSNANDNIGTGNHGTGVSGLIGAKGNNGSQLSGINWDVKIMQVDMAPGLSESNVINSYTYPLIMRQLYNSSNGASGAFVVATNASWGIDNGDPASAPLWCAFYDTLGYNGILNFGATSNSNVNIDVVGDLPTACGSDYMISVTATNSADVRTFSGYGQTTIDLAAPGQSVLSLSSNGGTSSASGTSYATPLTAGVCGLIYSVPCTNLADMAVINPRNAADIVRNSILDGVDPVANLTTETVTGGRLNANNSCLIVQTDCGTYTCSQSITTAKADVSCMGQCDGEITISGTDGSGAYTFDIGNGPQADSVFSGLCAGTYTVVVSDGVDCSYDYTITIIEPNAPVIGASIGPETFGNDGIINLSVTNGSAPYTYSWTGPSGFTSTVEDPTGLIGGDYFVTITDANGCEYVSEAITVSSVLQIRENNLEFSIHPNPAKENMTITLSSEESVDFLLIDQTGKLIQTQKLYQLTNQIDLSSLSAGIYIVKLSSTSGSNSTKKLVIL
ncbi:MAG: S8 family serine peptidase [Crocinitomicaceae bacterium]